jgi:hypothetical protein
MEALFVIVAGLGLYFLPTIVGYNKSNAGAIFLLNLFLGWTFIGWVVALVWASTTEPPRQVVPPSYNTSKPSSLSSVDEIMKLNTLREKGAITEIEYQKEKERILSR